MVQKKIGLHKYLFSSGLHKAPGTEFLFIIMVLQTNWPIRQVMMHPVITDNTLMGFCFY